MIERSCGILLPIASLPSPYGIGTLGQAAYGFVDFLADAGQTWWQILPVGPTSYGNSPYQSFSAFAGNPYFIDLDQLLEDGLLTREELDALPKVEDPSRINYDVLYQTRLPLLQKAANRGLARDREKLEAFTQAQQAWLPDYALFMALKRHFGMLPWTQWEDTEIRLRHPDTIAHYRSALSEDIQLFTYIQYLFFRQWDALRAYAHKKGVGIIGDLPIYVAMDSADVWANPGSFQLDEENLPTAVAGVPPDYFSEDGQLWGNPLYNWDSMKQDGYGWWIRRIGGASQLYDVLRIDHFRGFESYWSIPYGEETAKNGHWVKGPGLELLKVLTGWFPNLDLIAEDLGSLTPEVRQMQQDSGLPGMKVLEFAFDAREPSSYLPHMYSPNCVCYTGTHDNAPLMAWRDEADPDDLALAVRYLGLNDREGFHWGMLRGGLSSVANLFIAQMQDYLGLGAESRINIPGVLEGNWQWRLLETQLTPSLAKKMAETVRIYGRNGTHSFD